MKSDKHSKTDYDRVLEIYNSLLPQQKLFVAPKGRFVDSPSLIYRHLAPKDTGFVEMYKFHPNKDEAFITLAVRPDSQGKGIGKQLLRKAIEEAKAREDINSIIYRVDSANIGSDKLGASAGKLKKKTPDFTEYKIDTENQYKVSPEKRAIIKRVIDAYKKKFNADLSYMKFEDSPVAYYNNGKRVGDEFNLPFGGSWTKKKKIYLNEKMDAPMKAFNITESKDRFMSRIIAHELAHEIYRNKSDKKLRDTIASNAAIEGFITPYLKTVSPDKLAEETFAEYVADQLVNKLPTHYKSS